jgi:hypothetical protein
MPNQRMEGPLMTQSGHSSNAGAREHLAAQARAVALGLGEEGAWVERAAVRPCCEPRRVKYSRLVGTHP